MAENAIKKYHFNFIDTIKKIDPIIWNKVVGSGYPFLNYEFLLALEESACTTAESGWQPFHVTITEIANSESIIGVMPLYIKTNSTGEYVFDWAWADFYHQHGVQYYPKFVTSIPFTPSTGSRICILSGFNHAEIISQLANHITAQAKNLKISSWHLLFPQEELSKTLNNEGIEQRLGCQYQWFNDDFLNFEHFLDKFSSRKRKNIKKERSKIAASDITFEQLTGANINAEHWQHFFEFYQITYFIRGRQPYLNLDFFLNLGSNMPECLLLVLAVKNNQYIAGALSFIGNDTLYGRYWGCREEYQFLHFETCYYQGIEYCIENDLLRFDSGAQGEHKIQRGFEPVLTYSNHWISHLEFKPPISQFLQEEEKYILEYLNKARELLPFKKT